jgi:hypothetical protein
MATKKTDQTKATFTVLSPVDHNNERYEIGETVEMTQSQASSLLDQGIVEAVAAAA